jgi:hypothetical protein
MNASFRHLRQIVLFTLNRTDWKGGDYYRTELLCAACSLTHLMHGVGKEGLQSSSLTVALFGVIVHVAVQGALFILLLQRGSLCHIHVKQPQSNTMQYTAIKAAVV